METEGLSEREKTKEDRKDKRTKIQASQQSQMINQRNLGGPPKDFETTRDDTMGGPPINR